MADWELFGPALLGIFVLILALLGGYFYIFSPTKVVENNEIFQIPGEDSPETNGFPPLDGMSLDDLGSLPSTDVNGRPPASADILQGQTDRYSWSQTNQEVDIYVPVDKEVTKQQISCKILSDRLTLKVGPKTIIEGSSFADVVPDECNWQLGCTKFHIMSSKSFHVIIFVLDGTGNDRKIWITLFKARRSEQGRFWRSAIRGDLDINPAKNERPVYDVNPDDPDSVRSAMEQVCIFGDINSLTS
jgi:hypothetical protein